jgi:predicted small secreted protein
MERVFCALLLSLTTTTVFAQADSITGTWLTEDKEAHVEISESNNVYYGKIVWLREPNNPKTGKQWLDEEK